MRIYLASDHDGFELKAVLAAYLREQGYEVEDMGPYTLVPGDDYPDYCIPLAQRVAADTEAATATGSVFGIMIGLSGQGEAMAANRVRGARAAVYYGSVSPAVSEGQADEVLVLSRQHNDANILSLGAKFLTQEEVERVVKLWLAVPFSGDARHIRRIAELDHG